MNRFQTLISNFNVRRYIVGRLQHPRYIARNFGEVAIDFGDDSGKAVQVDPIKPTLKAPGSERLKLNCDILLSTSAFSFNLRRYTVGGMMATAARARQGLTSLLSHLSPTVCS
jgi:hypothetical protein